MDRHRLAVVVENNDLKEPAGPVSTDVEVTVGTREQLQQAADAAERWLDSLDPAAIASPDTDASRLRRIGDAVRAVANSQVELADAVAEARAHGHTWNQIAAMLGTSRQAAQERYGELAEHP